ncbi:MAG: phage holin family protein [Desulfomonilaceae bacterium]
MAGILIRWLITTVAILIVPYLISGVRVDSVWTALWAAAILGILNALIRPILFILTLPLTILTLGLFILVINALMFELAGALVSGLHVASFWSAFFASIIVTIVSWIMSSLVAGGGGETTVFVRRWNNTIDMHRGRGGRWE